MKILKNLDQNNQENTKTSLNLITNIDLFGVKHVAIQMVTFTRELSQGNWGYE